MTKLLMMYKALLPLFLVSVICTGCAHELPTPEIPGGNDSFFNTKIRIVVQGQVSDENMQPLEGIRVDIYGVREVDEPDAFSYNYTFSDSIGHFTISRYCGRKTDQMVTVVATDPKNRYKEQACDLLLYQWHGLNESLSEIWGASCNFIMTSDD